MFNRFIGSILFLSLYFCGDVSSFAGLTEIYPIIEEEVEKAKLDLDLNYVSDQVEISGVKVGIDGIWRQIKEEGFSEDIGIDKVLRPSYIVMQGIIESAVTKGLERGLVKEASIYIVTPRMPSPLMLGNGGDLRAVMLNDPKAFALYRNPILLRFLRAGGELKAYYSFNAKDLLAEQGVGCKEYEDYCTEFSNLIDSPFVGVEMREFPLEMTGAIYIVDGEFMTFETKQINQLNASDSQKWAIKAGKYAKDRKEEVDRFLEL